MDYNPNDNNNYNPNQRNERSKIPPFFSTEKRFEWGKVCNGNDLPRKYKKNTNYENLHGGLGRFINVGPKCNKKKDEIYKKYKPEYYQIKKKFKYDYNKYDFTRRVILPENNTEKKPVHKIRTFYSQEKDLRHTTDGSYRSLILKTPMTFPTKGRKRVNKSFDCGNRPDSEIFFDNKIEECAKGNEGLFGVERKIRRKEINKESVIPPYKFGRKHFFDKEKSTALF